MNRVRLRELGFELGLRAEAGVSDEGAWFAAVPDGAPVVLKWFPDETVVERYAVLLPALDELRSRGVPVPEYPHGSPSQKSRAAKMPKPWMGEVASYMSLLVFPTQGFSRTPHPRYSSIITS